jgi:hypothetical protein
LILAPDFRGFSFQIADVVQRIDLQGDDASIGEPDAERPVRGAHKPIFVLQLPALAEVEVRYLLAVAGESSIVVEPPDDAAVGKRGPDEARISPAEELIPGRGGAVCFGAAGEAKRSGPEFLRGHPAGAGDGDKAWQQEEDRGRREEIVAEGLLAVVEFDLDDGAGEEPGRTKTPRIRIAVPVSMTIAGPRPRQAKNYPLRRTYVPEFRDNLPYAA